MTDKEIIVDSIDVSECEFLWKEKLPKRFCNNGNLDCDCNSNPNCYYKQLKRKEQECEELKEDRERWKSNFNGKVSAIEELLQQLDQFKVKNIKISKTLTEIEFWVREFLKRTGQVVPNEIRQILQKISEVENGR